MVIMMTTIIRPLLFQFFFFTLDYFSYPSLEELSETHVTFPGVAMGKVQPLCMMTCTPKQ